MKRIGLMSDTHSHLDEQIFHYFADCDEIWHAGDFGSVELIERLEAFKPIKGVYGNIDGGAIRRIFPEELRFKCEDLDVWMIHIGGYPGKYPAKIKSVLQQNPPDLFICGHSHILKIIPDKQHNLLHINPGACGIEGWHQMKTVLRFTVEGKKIDNLELIELGLRGAIK